MSDATERTKNAEAAYKKIFNKRLQERIEEQRAANKRNHNIQFFQMQKAERREIRKRRANNRWWSI